MLVNIDIHVLLKISHNTREIGELIKHGTDAKLKEKFTDHFELIVGLVEVVSEERYKKENPNET